MAGLYDIARVGALMRAHESFPFTSSTLAPWAQGPSMRMANRMHGDASGASWQPAAQSYKTDWWYAIEPWLSVFNQAAASGVATANAATRTRVQVRNLRAWVRRQGVWVLLASRNSVDAVNVPNNLDMTDESATDVIQPADGGMAILPDPTGARVTRCSLGQFTIADPQNVQGVLVTCEARLIVDPVNGNVIDDRSSARYLLATGADYRPDFGVPLASVSPMRYMPGPGIGGFGQVTNDWRLFAFNSFFNGAAPGMEPIALGAYTDTAFSASHPSEFDNAVGGWTDLLIRCMGGDGVSTLAGGGTIPNPNSNARSASSAGVRAAVLAGSGNSAFPDNMDAIVQWPWFYARAGHASVNAGLEIGYGFCVVLRASTRQWEILYQGARLFGAEWPGGGVGNQILAYTDNTSYCQPYANYGYEMWPRASVAHPEVVEFYGAINGTVVRDYICIVSGHLARVIKADPNGVDDRYLARFVHQNGQDIYRSVGFGGVRYDAAGYPLYVMDGNSSGWMDITPDGEWNCCVCTTINELVTFDAYPPPWGDYTGSWPWNDPPTYGITLAELLANPPPDFRTGVPVYGGGSGEPTTPSTIIPRPTIGNFFARTSAATNNWDTGGVSTAPSAGVDVRRSRRRSFREE